MLKNFFKFKFLFLVFTAAPLLAVEPQKIEKKSSQVNELADLDFLIAATEKSLQRQKDLRERLVRFQELRTKSIADDNDLESLLKLSKSAYSLLDTIKEEHLIQIFEPAFIAELTLLAKPIMKQGK